MPTVSRSVIDKHHLYTLTIQHTQAIFFSQHFMNWHSSIVGSGQFYDGAVDVDIEKHRLLHLYVHFLLSVSNLSNKIFDIVTIITLSLFPFVFSHSPVDLLVLCWVLCVCGSRRDHLSSHQCVHVYITHSDFWLSIYRSLALEILLGTMWKFKFVLQISNHLCFSIYLFNFSRVFSLCNFSFNK